jgi:siderophore synthetase component
MSLRTVAPLATAAPHVKTAVDVQMTSAVRTVSPAAVHNGPRLSALLRELTADLPLDVLAETAAGAVLVDGQPQRHLAYLRRAAPRWAHGETVVPLAVLRSSPLLLGRRRPVRFGTTRHLLFAPLLAVLDRGVALEAHGQNTLLVLRGGRPAGSSTATSAACGSARERLRAAGVEAPPLRATCPATTRGCCAPSSPPPRSAPSPPS